MKKNNYVPTPVNTEDVVLPESLIELGEKIARNVHDVWTQSRIDEGWTYGPERNDDLKQTPCIVDYDELPEIEKEYDRNTAMETLKLIVKLGYTISLKKRFTPERITSLADNEIFVFGSNLAGMHGGGAARLAMDRFGAVWGQGVGLQGQCYAIPTMQGGVETIKPYVDEFIAFAKANSHLTFLVTKIGCGIAGFAEEEIAPLFKDAVSIENIVLPREFTV